MNTEELNIDNDTIQKLGLRLSDKPINAQVAPDARVFEYPQLEDVFVMESDLYGNQMPKGSCFLAFYGHHGLIGKQMSVNELVASSIDDIKAIVTTNKEG